MVPIILGKHYCVHFGSGEKGQKCLERYAVGQSIIGTESFKHQTKRQKTKSVLILGTRSSGNVIFA